MRLPSGVSRNFVNTFDQYVEFRIKKYSFKTSDFRSKNKLKTSGYPKAPILKIMSLMKIGELLSVLLI